MRGGEIGENFQLYGTKRIPLLMMFVSEIDYTYAAGMLSYFASKKHLHNLIIFKPNFWTLIPLVEVENDNVSYVNAVKDVMHIETEVISEFNYFPFLAFH